MVHVTVCRAHVRPVRSWLRARMLPQDDVMTIGTEVLMLHWGQIVDPIEVPVLAPVRATA
jgi:hypothetical protein